MAWIGLVDRKRKRSELLRRTAKRARISATSAGLGASAGARGRGGGAGGRRGAAAAMGPLKGRALRAAYMHQRARPAAKGEGEGEGEGEGGEIEEEEPLFGFAPPYSASASAPTISSPGGRNSKVAVDSLTVEAIRLEALSLPLPESLYSLALAVLGSESVVLMHREGGREEEEAPGGAAQAEADEKEDANEDGGGRVLSAIFRHAREAPHRWGRGWGALGGAARSGEESDAERGDRREAELVAALRGVAGSVGSIDRVLHTWKEAREALGEVLAFPGEGRGQARATGPQSGRVRSRAEGPKRTPHKRNLSVKRYAGMIRLARLESFRKWKALTSAPLPPPLEGRVGNIADAGGVDGEVVGGRSPAKGFDAAGTESDADTDTASPLSPLQRMDRLLDKRISDASEAAGARERELAERQDAAIADREEQEQARDRSSSLLRPLTEEEEAIVRKAIHGLGPPDEILAYSDTDTVQRESMQKLQPGVWLNDEVIHYFLLMLARRDEAFCDADPERRRCHFFKSFFLTKLLHQEGYRYGNVKRWSRKVPRKDIFALDKIFFPVNVGGMHWTVAVAFMQKRRIEFYDSMNGSGREELQALLSYLNDEHQAKKGSPLPDADEWELVAPDGVPQQRNGFDCGVFTCMFCDFMSTNSPLFFTQEHITQCRERIALSIMRGAALE